MNSYLIAMECALMKKYLADLTAQENLAACLLLLGRKLGSTTPM
jgi:hypothetical protein